MQKIHTKNGLVCFIFDNSMELNFLQIFFAEKNGIIKIKKFLIAKDLYQSTGMFYPPVLLFR